MNVSKCIIFSGFWFDGTQCSATLVPNLNGVFPALNFTCFNEIGYAGLLWTPLTGADIQNHQSLHYVDIQIIPTSQCCNDIGSK